jgi:tetratricopeptide (TPR) repeat protein
MGHQFISYSQADGLDFSLNLADQLAAGPPAVPVWVDKRNIRPGRDWDEQIAEAIRTCDSLVFVMTRDSVDEQSGCKQEWSRALKYKKPIVPILLHRDADMPFRLGSRQYIDFTGAFEPALAKLRNHLQWLASPEGVLQAMKDRLADARRDLLRAGDATEQVRIQDEIDELNNRIADQQRVVDQPEDAATRTKKRFESALERERQPEPLVAGETLSKFINRPPAGAPSWFQDRHVETGLIGDFLKDDALRLMTVVGRAGIGKTAMVCRLLKSLEGGRLPDDGAPLNVDGIVYLSATGSRRVNFPHLYADLCKLLPENLRHFLDAVYKNAQTSTEAKMQALLEAFPTGRTVILLDNFEDVVDTQTGEVRDAELDEALRALLKLPQHGVKVILTTRVAPHALQLLQPGRQMKIELDKGLESPYAENILRAMDRDGKVGVRNAPDELLAVARERTLGYPRALEALFAILAADRDTTLQEVLSDAKNLLPENVVQVLVGEAFSRLDPLAQRVMQALAVYAYPVPATAVDYLLQPHLPGIDAAPVLRRLVNMQFARRETGNYYLHHVDRAYALGRVPDGSPEDWRVLEPPPYSLPSLLHRGAEYFRKGRRDESTWRSAEDLNPLIAELDLLSASGDYEAALKVLNTMLPFLERWGYYRQVERLADTVARKAQEPVRSIASGLAGWAHSALGEVPQAIEHLKAALEAPISEAEPARAISWRLELAQCYAALGDHNAAAIEYRRVLDVANDNVETQVAALLGLGSADEAHGLHEEAENSYRRALHIYVPQLMMKVSKEDQFALSPGTLPPDVPVTTPLAWYPISRLEPVAGPERPEVLYVFGIETAAVETDGAKPEDTSYRGKEAETSVELIRVLITADLANIWMSLAGLYGRTDRLSESEACCRLALAMYGALEIDLGVARALDLLRRIVAQVSDTEAEVILAAQEEVLKDARALGHRRLEIAVLNDLAECYLERSQVDNAEALYFDLSRHAAELEDLSLRTQADIGLARIEWFRGKPDAAVAKLETLRQNRLQDLQLQTDVFLMLARIEWNRGRRNAAVKYALTASRDYAALNSPMQQLEAERLLASIAIDQRDYGEAVRRLESALLLVRSVKTPSRITSVFCDLAKAYASAGAREQAVAAVGEAVKVASNIDLPSTAAEALMAIGQVESQLKEFEPAETAYHKAKETYANIGDLAGQIDALHALAHLYHELGLGDAKINVAREAWRIAENLKDRATICTARVELALALSDCGFHPEAIQHMEVAVAENPNNAWAVGCLGWVLYQAGEYDRSLEESGRALDLDPERTWIIQTLGHAYLAKNLPDDAEREYRRLVEGRRGGEDFAQVIREVKDLLSQKPYAQRGHEILKYLEEEQRKLEVEEKSAGTARSS